MIERGRVIEHIPGTSPVFTLAALPEFKKLSENRENQRQGFWDGDDLEISEVTTSNGQISGTMKIPHGYFENGLDPAQEFLLAGYLVSREQFSVRSRLAQAGVYPRFRKVSIDRETLDISVNVTTQPVHDKPFVNVPERFSFGRLYAASVGRNLKGKELEQYVARFNAGYSLNSDMKGLFVSMTVPVVKFYEIGVQEIDLGKVLGVDSGKRAGTRDLDEALSLREVPLRELRGRFVLGETARMRVPEDKKLLIVPGIDESEVMHLPSQVIDASSDWPIRTEQLVGSHDKYKSAVEFLVYSSGK